MQDIPTSALPLLAAAAAREGDRRAVEAGDTWTGLMERAAGHLARGVVRVAGGGYGRRVALLVGKGDNGGDGYAAARRLEREHGATAWVLAVDGLDTDVSEATTAVRTAWLAMGGRTSAGTDHLGAALAWCDVAVDCLLGTGASGAPRGASGTAVAALVDAHARGLPVVACDLPSGVDADDGSVAGAAVVADLTVTFGALKRGLLLHPAAAYTGELVLGELGPRYRPPDTAPRWAALTPAGAAPAVLPADADKRARGRVLVVAGAAGTSGAAALAADAALRSGAGLVTASVPEPVRAEVAARCDAGVMVRGVPADELGAIAADAVHALPDTGATGDLDVAVAGPGLGHGPGAAAVVAHLRASADRLVLDADGLNVHRDDPDGLADHVGALVLTPHERELARIGGGEDGPDAWARRATRVPDLAARYDATIVAKGPGTLVAAPDGRVWVTPIGSPALGSGGTGDALSGIIGAAIATADDVPLAVARAVWWHAAAGLRAGRWRAGRGSATDVLAELPGVLADLLDAPTGGAGAVSGARRGRLPWTEAV